MSRRHQLEKGTAEYAQGADAFRGRRFWVEENPVQISNRYLKARIVLPDENGRPKLTPDGRAVAWSKPRRVRIPKQCRLLRERRLPNG